MGILLHICCAPCATHVIRQLMIEGHKVTGLFYNPNVHPSDEYERRKAAARDVCKQLGVEFISGAYDRQSWFLMAREHQADPEGGRRCGDCFRMRLERSFGQMRSLDLKAFATTLTVSPHKNAELVNRIGQEIGGDKFLVRDFKRNDGYRKSVELSRQAGLYRQDYCGCIYSLEERLRERAQKG